MDKIKIDLGFERTLVIEKGTDKNHNEVFVGIIHDGVWIQDIAVIGSKYHYDNNCNVIRDEGISVKVYADANNEDYTNEHLIDFYKEEE